MKAFFFFKIKIYFKKYFTHIIIFPKKNILGNTTGPRLVLKLDGQPSFHPYWMISSACLWPVLAPPLGLILLRGVGSSYFHHFLTFLLPLSLVIDGIRSEGLGGWRGGKLGCGCLPRRISPRMGL